MIVKVRNEGKGLQNLNGKNISFNYLIKPFLRTTENHNLSHESRIIGKTLLMPSGQRHQCKILFILVCPNTIYIYIIKELIVTDYYFKTFMTFIKKLTMSTAH